MSSIRSRIVVLFTLFFGIVLTGFASLIYVRLSEAERSTLDARLESEADKLATELGENAHDGTFPDSVSLSEILAGGIRGAHMQVVGMNRSTLLFDSMLSAAAGSLPSITPGTGALKRATVSSEKGEFRCLLLSSEAEDSLKFVVQLASPTDDLRSRQTDLLYLFAVAIPLALFLTALAASAIARKALQPISSIIRTADQISANNLGQRLELPQTRDEVRALAETFNRMVERIDAAFRSQQQFVADASHEMRTPLTVLRNELEFAIERLNDPAVKDGLQTSLAEADRLAHLAEDLLLLARIDASKLRLELMSIRLDEILLECIQHSNALATKKGIRFKVTVDDVVHVEGDRERLKSIFFNLLNNAIKYSPDHTTVTVSLTGNPTRNMATVSIKDEGEGISAESLPHIFKRFYRADASRSGRDGHGLGLAIVERLVQLHRGEISVVSQPGNGSTFTVEFPLARPA